MIPSSPKIPHMKPSDWDKLRGRSFVVQEKIDGSQCSFMKDGDGRLWMRSKKVCRELTEETLATESPKSQFYPAMKHFLAHKAALSECLIYRGEAMKGPKHNVLCYEKAPIGNFVLFDVEDRASGISPFYGPSWLFSFYTAEDIEVEAVVQSNYRTSYWDKDDVLAELERPSSLGGMREGVVIKTVDSGERLVFKIVAESFREKKSRGSAGKKRDLSGTPLDTIVDLLSTEARFRKATGAVIDVKCAELDMTDTGACIQELLSDLCQEEASWIANELYEAFYKKIHGQVTKNFVNFYRDKFIGGDE